MKVTAISFEHIEKNGNTMDFLTTRRLIASILPIISLGLIIGSVVVDDWYSTSYIVGEKNDEEIWEEYSVDYGLQEFRYLKLWSGIFGDNYDQKNSTYQGEIGDMFSYILNSSIILSVLHIPLLIFCALVTVDRSKPWIPMMISLIIFLGIITMVYYYYEEVDSAVSDHIDSSLEPLNLGLEGEVKEGLKGSGTIGSSFYILAGSAIFPLLTFLLLIRTPSEKDPSRKQLEDGFFKR